MNRRDITEPDQRAVLDAYRAEANAEADAHFDDRALEAQRHKILARLAGLAHGAKVIRFPIATPVDAPSTPVNRRWISVAAAAGLIIGLLGGQLVNLMPQPTRRLAPMASSMAPSVNDATPGFTPARMIISQDDGFLSEVDFAVQVRSASELRALDELTPFHEPR
jgi:hypothetical protein